jgi:HprK-related kinase A
MPIAMRLSEIPEDELDKTFSQQGIRFRSGPFSVHLRSDLPRFIRLIQRLYGSLNTQPAESFSHFHIRIDSVRAWRRLWLRQQSLFRIDGLRPFEPYPLDHALPLFEWGLNWCVGMTAHQHLMLHSAVLEKNGMGLIMPALPGSGKSTLCAALAYRGWRLLSDEFGIVRHVDGRLLPMPRAIGLKNESIRVIAEYAPDAWIGPSFENTRKGTVAHVAPPPDSLERQAETVPPRWVVFPRYAPNADLTLDPQAKSLAFTRLSNNSFNYQVTMENGFRTLTTLADRCDAYLLKYSSLDDAVSRLNRLAEGST